MFAHAFEPESLTTWARNATYFSLAALVVTRVVLAVSCLLCSMLMKETLALSHLRPSQRQKLHEWVLEILPSYTETILSRVITVADNFASGALITAAVLDGFITPAVFLIGFWVVNTLTLSSVRNTIVDHVRRLTPEMIRDLEPPIDVEFRVLSS